MWWLFPGNKYYVFVSSSEVVRGLLAALHHILKSTRRRRFTGRVLEKQRKHLEKCWFLGFGGCLRSNTRLTVKTFTICPYKVWTTDGDKVMSRDEVSAPGRIHPCSFYYFKVWSDMRLWMGGSGIKFPMVNLRKPTEMRRRLDVMVNPQALFP